MKIGNKNPAFGENFSARFARSKKLVFILLFGGMLFFFTPFISFSQSTGSLEEELTGKLFQINSQITSYRAEIQRLSTTNRSLQEEVELIDKKVDKTKLEMQAADIVLQDLKIQSDILQKEIDALQVRIGALEERLSHSIEILYQLDQHSSVEIFFSHGEFSDFFNQIQYLRDLQKDIKKGLGELSEAKAQVDKEEERLDSKLISQERLLALQHFEQQEMESNKQRKTQIIQTNTSHSNSIERKNSALEDVARQLRERLYVLKGLTQSVGLNEAYKKASTVSSKVGINPAFLMAVLKVESDLGNNIGGGNWQKDMHARDKDAFLQITQKLKFDPDKMPVSSAPKYGWGGAMGPAQFLPSTWLSYEERVVAITGHNPPNPWDLEDAFAAAGIKLAATGATSKESNGEWEAAMRYFAGGGWKNPAYSFYGDRVMAVKDLIENQFKS